MLPPVHVPASASPTAVLQSQYAGAQSVTRHFTQLRDAAEGHPSKTPLSAQDAQELQSARMLSQAMHQDMAAVSPAQKAGKVMGKQLYTEARKYFPIQKAPSGKYVLRNTVNGVPVIPPGMKGKQLDQFVEHTSAAIQERHAKTLVFISLSMPKILLKRMFAADWRFLKYRDHTVFVLRGWPAKPQGLPMMLGKLVALFPSPSKQPDVEVDPILFTGHHINRVPVILHEAPDGKWGAIAGDGYGFSAAIKRINHGKGSDTKVFGRTWKIKEPNLIKTIDQRAQKYPWKAEEHRALQRSMPLESQELAVSLPQSRKPLDYAWNPTIVASHTMRLPDGQALAYRGEKVNPLRYMSAFPFGDAQRFVVFNPEEPWQVNQVQAWVGTYKDITLMATVLPTTPAAYKSLVERFHHPLYAANALLDARLGVRAVPSLVGIDGLRLRDIVPAIPRYAPPPKPGKEQ
ncbi:conjugal transfer protein TraW [Acidithiobacillus sp. MC6.1]|nr:conjugal transfer protein TraW [Acidithiobacillus sp. MC6.1]